jgi:hypothetical protein
MSLQPFGAFLTSGNLIIEALPPTSLPVDQSSMRSFDPPIIIISSPFPRKMTRHTPLPF